MDTVHLLVGDRLVELSPEMRKVLEDGGRLIGLPIDGSVLVVPVDVRQLVEEDVALARRAFSELQTLDPSRIDRFFSTFADAIADDGRFAAVLEANNADVVSARQRGRATGRLEITSKMRNDMVAGLRMWADLELDRLAQISTVEHIGWRVESWRAPLGVVGFVFEGRPNVFADAMGVLKSGNTVVFRIGSDALGTARAMRDHILRPSLQEAGLPQGSVVLIDSPEHAAGWALFGNPGLSLAVARGSGPAVAQLGEVARQHGVPVSLHGTGGAWLIVGSRFDPARLSAVIRHSLDRKVCNTLNTLVLTDLSKSDALSAVSVALDSIGGPIRVHAVDPDVVDRLTAVGSIEVTTENADPGHEWEWDDVPELTVITKSDVPAAVASFNDFSPKFVLSVVSDDDDEVEGAWRAADAPFFGDGFTRWVDGQFALDRPELGLANWQGGRLLGRGGVLSGDGVHTVRLRVRQTDAHLHR